jgi:hypothetical protein
MTDEFSEIPKNQPSTTWYHGLNRSEKKNNHKPPSKVRTLPAASDKKPETCLVDCQDCG